MSYQFSNVQNTGRTQYFPLEVSRVARSQSGGIELTNQFSRFVFLTTYNETFEATWTVNDSNFGALNKSYRYSQTNRKITLSFKLPARNVADSKENLEFCQKLARLTYGKYYRQEDSQATSVFTFNTPTYNYQGALFDIRFNFGNLIRNENVYISEFEFATNFDAGIFEYNGTEVGLVARQNENSPPTVGRLQEEYFQNDRGPNGLITETGYVYHSQKGKIYPKEVEVSLQMTILHDYPLGFGGPRREAEPLKWAENKNRDWPHGTGPTYPVLEYMSEDEIELPTVIVPTTDSETPEGETPEEEPLSFSAQLGEGRGEIRYTVDEYGNVVFLD